MKLRLFALRSASSPNKLVPDLYFPDKQSAKRKRDQLNTEGTERYVVTPGPDHRRYR